MTRDGNFGLLSEHIVAICCRIGLGVPTVVHMVRPLFPERFSSITGLCYRCVMVYIHLYVVRRVGIGQ